MSGSIFMLLLRLGFSLALVLGMIWGAARMLRTRGGVLLRNSGSRLEIIERKPLGKASSVALVRVDGQTLVLGVSEHGVNVLADVVDPERDEMADAPTGRPVDLSGVVPVATGTGSLPTATVSAPNATVSGPTGAVTTTPGVRAEQTSFVEALRELTVRRPTTRQR